MYVCTSLIHSLSIFFSFFRISLSLRFGYWDVSIGMDDEYVTFKTHSQYENLILEFIYFSLSIYSHRRRYWSKISTKWIFHALKLLVSAIFFSIVTYRSKFMHFRFDDRLIVFFSFFLLFCLLISLIFGTFTRCWWMLTIDKVYQRFWLNNFFFSANSNQFRLCYRWDSIPELVVQMCVYWLFARCVCSEYLFTLV